MRTARSSSRRGGVWSWSPWISPLDVDLDLIPLNFPLGCGPGYDPPQFSPWVWPGSDPPQYPPWMWAWIWSPSISPLGCEPGSDPPQFPPWLWCLDLIPLNFPLGCGPGPEGGLHQAPPSVMVLLVCWPSGVLAFWCGAFCCGGLLLWWPSGVVVFWCGAIPVSGHLQ